MDKSISYRRNPDYSKSFAWTYELNKDPYKCYVSSNINEVIRPVLKFFFFFFRQDLTSTKKYKKALKSTKKHQKAPKSTKNY